jgi:hypothetical protein
MSLKSIDGHLIGSMLEQQRQYFSEHVAELLAQHLERFVISKGGQLIGASNTIEDARARRFGLTKFLVRQVSAIEEKPIDIPALRLEILRADSFVPFEFQHQASATLLSTRSISSPTPTYRRSDALSGILTGECDHD